MKPIPTSAVSVIVSALLCFSFNASAVTVGKLKGAALLGQPLAVSATVDFAQDDDITSPCLEVNVNYGDIRQSSAQTELTVLPGRQLRQLK